MRSSTPILLSLVTLTGCLSDAELTDTTSPDATSSDEAADHEGEVGHLRVSTPEGMRTLAYVVENGHAIHEGDMDLGPIEELEHLRGGAVNMGKRWPNSRVYYRLDADFDGQVCGKTKTNCTDIRDRVRATFAAMSEKLPISIIEDVGKTQPNYITLKWADPDENFGGQSNSTGMGGGEQTIIFPSGHLKDTTLSESVVYNLQPTTGTLRHEMLHAIGLWHEQSRSDRDSFITINENCIQEDQLSQFEKKSGATSVGPYDFASIMHYGTDAFCVPWLFPTIPNPNPNPVEAKCMCGVMSSKMSGVGGVIGGGTRPAGFSIEDTNTLYRMYARPLASNDANDHYGRAVAVGDFDDDGYDDLAVGVPDEEVLLSVTPVYNNVYAGGRVALYKGTSAGLVAWHTLTEFDMAGTVTPNGRFGTALVALDFDADGIKDLAVGAPGANNNSGAVFVFLGNQSTKPKATHMLTQRSLNYYGYTDESGDRFGETLAAGPITGLTREDSCREDLDGTPYDALVIGAPGDRNPVPFSTETQRSGAVYITQTGYFISCKRYLTSATRLALTRGATGDDYGAALAVGDLDGDGMADLAVGAPHRNANSGAVYTYGGRLPPGGAGMWGSMVTTGATLSGSINQQFGAALAIGELASEYPGIELAIGAPGLAGKVAIYAYGLSPIVVKNLANYPYVVGDRYGAALAIGNVDNQGDRPDLVIGIPGQDGGAGAIEIVNGGLLTKRTKFRQNDLSPLFDSAPNDGFGSSLAIGHLDGGGAISSTASTGTRMLDLVIGMPGEAPDQLPYAQGPAGSGMVMLMKGNLFGVASAWHQISQAYAGSL